jgi:hypothetical protein
MKPCAETVRKIKKESTYSTDNGLPNSDDNPSYTLAISTIANIPTASSAFGAPVIKLFSLEPVIQAETQAKM